MVQFLLDHGADVNVVDAMGTTALSEAQEHGHADVAALLIAHGAKMPPSDDSAGEATAPAPPAVADVPQDPYEAAMQGGCLGRAVEDCLKKVQITFQFAASSIVDDQITSNDAVDVNGQPIHADKSLSILGNLAGFDGPSNFLTLNIDYSNDRSVSFIELGLPADPALADTEAEYDRTGLYEAIVTVAGRDCPTMSRIDIYRFFQNTVKPKMVNNGKTYQYDDLGAGVGNSRTAGNIPFCGHMFSFSEGWGYNTNLVTLNNPHGTYLLPQISFK